MAALSHIKSDTIGDFTGTITGFNSQGSTTTINATDLVRPSDWNSVHNFFQTITGNTSGSSTADGTNLVIGGSNGITLEHSTAASIATMWIKGDSAQQSFYPYPPASTVTQTNGAQGATTGSMWVFPHQIHQPIQFNAMRMHFSASWVSSTIAGSQTITHRFGIYTKNAASLSLVSSSSYSFAISNSSGSGTLSYPTSTGTGGYGYGTTSWSASGLGQSIVGSVGQRYIDMQLGNTLEVRPRQQWFVFHQRQSSAGFNGGLSTAMIANVMFPWNNAAPIGQSSAGRTTNASDGFRPFGVFTSTNSAGHSGTALLDAIAFSGIANTISNMPLVGYLSTS